MANGHLDDLNYLQEMLARNDKVTSMSTLIPPPPDRGGWKGDPTAVARCRLWLESIGFVIDVGDVYKLVVPVSQIICLCL